MENMLAVESKGEAEAPTGLFTFHQQYPRRHLHATLSWDTTSTTG